MEDDTTKLFEEGERVELKVETVACTHCGVVRARRRKIDLMIADGKIKLYGVRVIYCPDCQTLSLDMDYLTDLAATLHKIGMRFDETKPLLDEIVGALLVWQEKYSKSH